MSGKANKKSPKADISDLQKQINELKAENNELKKSVKSIKQPKERHFWRTFGATFFVTLSVVSFMLFNLSSWMEHTLLDTDRFVATVQPVLKEPAVQKELQEQITNSIFENIDVEGLLVSALPQNVSFIAGPLSSQVESFVNGKVGELLASEKVYNVWGEILAKVQSATVSYLQNENTDGVISVNELYTFVGNQINQDQKISFLFNKQLPEKIGTINIAELNSVPEMKRYVDLLTKAPPIFLLISVVSLLLAILLSLRKRNLLVGYTILSIIMTAATLGAIYAGGLFSANQTSSDYQDLISSIYNVMTEALVSRTFGFLVFFVCILIVILATKRSPKIQNIKQKTDSKIQHLSDDYLPKYKLPEWIVWVSDNSGYVSWGVFAAIFVLTSVRLFPTVDMVISGFLLAIFGAVMVYVTRVVVKSLNRK